MVQRAKIDIFHIKEIKVVVKQYKFYFVIKRFMDIIGSLFLLFLLLPLILITTLTIIIFEGTPVLFKQERIGKDEKSFIIWKFRTMQLNKSSTKKSGRSWTNGVPDDFIFKSSVAMNVTKIGFWLRKFSIDEIPQLINVLKGEMSFIGPRPEIPEIVHYYNECQMQRLYVKPGITGYAQVNGRSNINHGEKIHYDLKYVKNCSFLLDTKIVFLTIIKVIKADGAV
ncbi:sugar transferase [Pseudogracilibacillus auburnensis]|uniref:Lipopolysaccharide/colanic/teichoic acid biosynthesis glycosyltransferase n=1 Tax=Pseudogracilibacillus auburnensis TaxID=1494959 RepID=A0A2V3W5E3_9BACI|nr:sugar transferase [Pseudogracilibacillus auburnensis]PXW89583.1 lipopolysaccharide/colanic/teichoic acid biosynthesis glycosyltransferase [Pseudogracilibacillus auburnensis]